MMSSRCPRPIGTMESIALSPVCTGWPTDWRVMTPGATFSMGEYASASIGPLPSMGSPSELTTPPEQAPAHRHLEDTAGALDGVSLGYVGVVAHDHGAHGVAFEVESEPEGVARELDHLALHDLAETMDAGNAVGESHDAALGAGFHPDVKVPDPAVGSDR